MLDPKYLAAAAFWVGALVQLRPGGQTATRRWSGTMFVLFGLALTFDISGVYHWFDRLVAVPNLANLLSHACGTAGIYMLWTMLRSVINDVPTRVRQREAVGLGLALIALAVLFLAMNTDVDDPAFTVRYGHLVTEKIYWLISAGYAVACLVQLGITVARSEPHASRRDITIGLSLAAWGGGAFGFVYIALKLSELATAGSNARATRLFDRLTNIVLPIGMVLLAGGLLLPVASRGATNAAQNLRIRSRLVRLRRLRADLASIGLLTDEGSELSGAAPLLIDIFGFGVRDRLLRRVVEIRDALLAIQTRVADADGDEVTFIRAARKAGLDVDLPSARVLADMAVEFGTADDRTVNGLKRLDLVREASELADLGAAWTRRLAAAA